MHQESSLIASMPPSSLLPSQRRPPYPWTLLPFDKQSMTTSFFWLTSARGQKGIALGERDESTTGVTGVDWTIELFSKEVFFYGDKYLGGTSPRLRSGYIRLLCKGLWDLLQSI